MAGALLGIGARAGGVLLPWLGRMLFGSVARTALTAATIDQVVTGGQGRDALLGTVTEQAGKVFMDQAGLSPETLQKNLGEFVDDIQNGRIGEILENPMTVAALSLITFGAQTMGGNGILNSAINTLLIGGLMFAAQKYVLPKVFGNNADAPQTPAPALDMSQQQRIEGPEPSPNL